MIGKKVGNYLIKSELGTGGMGVVYFGENTNIGLKVAIKMLHPHLIKSPVIKERFLKEAKTQAILNHPNITKVYDYIQNQDGLFIILEYLNGEPLNDYIFKTKGLLPEKEAHHFMVQILDAVGYAHNKGVVHRDIKAANIMITPSKEIKVMDFGIAKIANESLSLTKTGAHMGSPLYMSPEQVKGEQIDHRTDIYSLGVVYHEMLTGVPVYDQTSTTEFEIYNKIVKEPLPRIRNFYTHISDKIQQSIDIATAKHPTDRFQSCEDFKSAILNLPGQPIKKQLQPYKERLKPAPVSAPLGEKSRSKSSGLLFLFVLIAMILAGLGFFALYPTESEISRLMSTAKSKVAEYKYHEADSLYREVLKKEKDNEAAMQGIEQVLQKSFDFQEAEIRKNLIHLNITSLESFPVENTVLADAFQSSFNLLNRDLGAIKSNPKVIKREAKYIDTEIKHLNTLKTYFDVKKLIVDDCERAEKLLDDNQNLAETHYIISLRQELKEHCTIYPMNSEGIRPPIFPNCNQNNSASAIKNCFGRQLKRFIEKENNINLKRYQDIDIKPLWHEVSYEFVVDNKGGVKNINVSVHSGNETIRSDIERILSSITDITPAILKENHPVAVSYSGNIVIKIPEPTTITNGGGTGTKPLPIERPCFSHSCRHLVNNNDALMECTNSEMLNHIVDNTKAGIRAKLREDGAEIKLGTYRIEISFEIGANGYAVNPSVSTIPIQYKIEEEVLKSINSLPKMQPKALNYQPVNCKHSFTININI